MTDPMMSKIHCPTCGKRVSVIGLDQHHQAEHGCKCVSIHAACPECGSYFLPEGVYHHYNRVHAKAATGGGG